MMKHLMIVLCGFVAFWGVSRSDFGFLNPAQASGPDSDHVTLGWWIWENEIADLEAWLGRDIEIAHRHLVFNQGFKQALSDREHLRLQQIAAAVPEIRLAVLFDLYPITRNEPRFAEVAGGVWDAKLREVARMLINTGHEDAILRLWHEPDLSARTWYADPNWITAWRRVHDQMMAVDGAAFTWQFNVNGGDWRRALEQGWPGDAYVDDVAISCYDKLGNGFMACRDRLVFARDFAIAHGKTLSWAEWGLWASGGGDNPAFIEDSHAFFADIPPESRGYMLYFNKHEKVDLDQFPKTKARLRELFGFRRQ